MKPYVNTALSVITPIVILWLDKQVNNHVTYVVSFIIIVGVILWCVIQKRKQPYNNLQSFLSDKENYDTLIRILKPQYIEEFFKDFSYDSYWPYKKLDAPLYLVDSEIRNIKFHHNKLEDIKNRLMESLDNFMLYKSRKTWQSNISKEHQTVREDESKDPKIYNESSEILSSLSKEVGKIYIELIDEWRIIQSKISE